MKKILFLMVMIALVLCGCGSATVSMKNMTGHNAVTCEMIINCTISGRTLDVDEETTVTMIQAGDISATAKKVEPGWQINASGQFHISRGIFAWDEKRYIILVYPDGELVLQER